MGTILFFNIHILYRKQYFGSYFPLRVAWAGIYAITNLLWLLCDHDMRACYISGYGLYGQSPTSTDHVDDVPIRLYSCIVTLPY